MQYLHLIHSHPPLLFRDLVIFDTNNIYSFTFVMFKDFFFWG